MPRKKISQAGEVGPAGLACPKCGSTQFKPKRSKKSKALLIPAFGVSVFAAPKSQVKCIACGKMYKRG